MSNTQRTNSSGGNAVQANPVRGRKKLSSASSRGKNSPSVNREGDATENSVVMLLKRPKTTTNQPIGVVREELRANAKKIPLETSRNKLAMKGTAMSPQNAWGIREPRQYPGGAPNSSSPKPAWQLPKAAAIAVDAGTASSPKKQMGTPRTATANQSQLHQSKSGGGPSHYKQTSHNISAGMALDDSGGAVDPSHSHSSLKKSKQKQQQKQQQRVERDAFSKLLQPKKDAAVLTIDVHHSAGMLGGGFFSPSHSAKGGTAANRGVGDRTDVASATALSNPALEDRLGLYHQLPDGKTIQKGRQRLRPQKKKFTGLKKKVLEERLRKWKALHPDYPAPTIETSGSFNNKNNAGTATTVCLVGFCETEELEDDDEYEEIVKNLRDMASRVGCTQFVFIPRAGDYIDGAWPAWIKFASPVTQKDGEHEASSKTATNLTSTMVSSSLAAQAAVSSWSGLVLGGSELRCVPLNSELDGDDSGNETAWQQWCLSSLLQMSGSEGYDMKRNNDIEAEISPISNAVVFIDNALAEEDMEDEESLAECLQDLRAIVSKFGSVLSVEVEAGGKPPILRITYADDARGFLGDLNKVTVGGQQWSARMTIDDPTNKNHIEFVVSLRNVVTADDLEDDDCLEESLSDIKELAQRFGTVKTVALDKTAHDATEVHDRCVQIYFSTVNDALACVSGFNGTVIGGLTVSASMQDSDLSKSGVEPESNQQHSDDEPGQMLSGDKVISGRFAECKRVPKIPNQMATRQYATILTDETIKPTLVEMLSELMRLQKRAMEDKNAKARRRLVMGLREVARGIRSHKVKLVVMANNLDEYGIIDKTLQEIIDLAKAEEVPVFYELTKRALGKAIGKTIKVSVVGIQNADGAHQQFKKLMSYAS